MVYNKRGIGFIATGLTAWAIGMLLIETSAIIGGIVAISGLVMYLYGWIHIQLNKQEFN